MCIMRTTVSIDERLLGQAKRRARQGGLTLGQLIEAALRRELARSRRSGDRPDIPVFRDGTGLRPGVDASSTRTLLEAIDRDTPVEKLR